METSASRGVDGAPSPTVKNNPLIDLEQLGLAVIGFMLAVIGFWITLKGRDGWY